MTWLYIAVASYFFTAIANILDKLLLTRFLKAASIYAFYVGLLGILSLVLIPFGVELPGMFGLLLALLIGVLFIVALFLMYSGFLRGETTRVATVIGGSLPIYTFIFSALLLGERLDSTQLIAFAFLVAGMFVIAAEKATKSANSTLKSYLPWALTAGLLFSLSFVGSKYIYNTQEFISGFFWMRMGSFLAALIILAIPVWRRQVREDMKAPKADQGRSKGLLLFNQAIGATGFVLLNVAIDLGSVTLVNAMQGLQYVFIFILAIVIGSFIPEVKERLSRAVVIQKIAAISLIVVGLVFLSF